MKYRSSWTRNKNDNQKVIQKEDTKLEIKR